MDKEYSITESQLGLIYGLSTHQVQDNITDWFPGLFKIKLIVGQWYKVKNTNISFCFNGDYGNNTQYGFNDIGEFEESGICIHEGDECTSLSQNEVIGALTKEALKRGFVDGAHYQWENCPLRKVKGNDFIFEGGAFRINGFSIMGSEGKWAEIIKTITKGEAEKILNCKIIEN